VSPARYQRQVVSCGDVERSALYSSWKSWGSSVRQRTAAATSAFERKSRMPRPAPTRLLRLAWHCRIEPYLDQGGSAALRRGALRAGARDRGTDLAVYLATDCPARARSIKLALRAPPRRGSARLDPTAPSPDLGSCETDGWVWLTNRRSQSPIWRIS
jgi:hypothetical protein